MGIISIVLLVIFVMAAIIMILVILMQDDQGEGVAGMFGGGGTTPVGSRSGNVLTRFTSILAAVFIVGAFALAWLNRTPESSDIVERARLERLRAAEAQDWWVERVEQPPITAGDNTMESAAPAESTSTGAEQPPSGGQGQDTVPESINR
jgi:preprotein translocase subunit SecG